MSNNIDTIDYIHTLGIQFEILRKPLWQIFDRIIDGDFKPQNISVGVKRDRIKVNINLWKHHSQGTISTATFEVMVPPGKSEWYVERWYSESGCESYPLDKAEIDRAFKEVIIPRK